MRDKPNDIPYCGVRKSVIDGANPVLDPYVLSSCWEWLRDRYQIHVKKDVQGLPAPWTTNPVLLQVKFCNVRREHDRQSQYLIKHVLSQDWLTLQDKMFNCAIFRMFNMWEPLEAIGAPFTIEKFMQLDLEVVRQLLQEYESRGGKCFTNAFNTGGLKQCLAFPERVARKQRDNKGMVKITDSVGKTVEMDYKQARDIASSAPDSYKIEGWEAFMPMRVIRYMREFLILNEGYFDYLLALPSPLEVYESLLSNIEGLGPFLAYQIWVDFTYNPDYPFSENHFTIAGPGCKAGIDLLFTDKSGMTHEECIFWLVQNQDKVFTPFGYDRQEFWCAEEPHDQRMNLQQTENMFCELQKYLRGKQAIKEGKKPRGKVGYNGFGEAPSGSKNLLNLFNK